ncbi:MAG: isoprenyl transferase [Lachnospiraceae bacterium]|nr:isoprenyl transferase [Lachnospiraceae bacterium]MBR3004200.1 isoprenyl transferase [Lachnospiraceae bacterium]MBR6350305.1 isoprenyl transferase [Lachnospiraceae bacterium]
MDQNELKIPQHVAIIMDGNGRWAKKRHMPRTFGHAQGARVLEQTLEDCSDLGVKYLTVYAFSTENWARPFEEVQVIMNLFRDYLISAVDKCNRNNVRCMVIGERSRLSQDIIDSINNLENATKDNTGITFIVAINYGSRDEIVRAVNSISREVQEGNIQPGEITAETIEQYLDTRGIPDPDLLIRTSGEERLSNFLMWQLAYTEFYFTDTAWPDFDKNELLKAFEKYSSRDRRYGKVK